MNKFIYITISVIIITSIVLLTSYAREPEIIEVEKIVYIDRIQYVDRIEYEFINFFVDGYNVNKILQFYSDKPEDYEEILDFYDFYTKSRKITDIIIKQSIENNIPVHLMFALARRESGFNYKMESRNKDKSWDYGLFQLNSFHVKWKKADYFNIEKNTIAAAGLMQWLLKEFERDDLALAAYNAGYGKIKEKNIPYTTSMHVFEIKRFEKEFDSRFSIEILPNLNLVLLEPGKIQLK